jgi:hypothetical protein
MRSGNRALRIAGNAVVAVREAFQLSRRGGSSAGAWPVGFALRLFGKAGGEIVTLRI